jgi:hypothetical protein
MEKFVLDSPALEEAVKLRSTTNYPPRRPGRSSLKEVQATGGGEYDGMFAVTVNEDGTASVKGGWVFIEHNALPHYVGDAIIPYLVGNWVCLVARKPGIRDPWELFFTSCTPMDLPNLYVPGTQMYMEIAGPRTRDNAPAVLLVQYWQGGAVRFAERYYVG